MSKSLKNFITIKNILSTTTPRILRLFYSQARYNSVLNFDPDDNFTQATAVDKKIDEYFKSVRYYLRNQSDRIMSQTQKLNSEEKDIVAKLDAAKVQVHEAMCDNFNTPKVLSVLQELITVVNKYIDSVSDKANWIVLNNTYVFVKEILYCMGFEYKSFSSGETNDKAIDILVDLRKQIRIKAKEAKDSELFDLCGEYRDRILKELNVQIEEKGDTTMWKRVQDQNNNIDNVQKSINKSKNESKIIKEAEELYPPNEHFIKDKKLGAKFGNYLKDENGVPCAFENGTQLSQKERAYCLKEYANYVAKYNKSS